MPEPEPGERFPRSKFLEASTLGLGAVIGGLVTVPALGFMVVPAFEDQGYPKVDLGPLENFSEGQWFVTTRSSCTPSTGEVSRRTAYIRNNGSLERSSRASRSSRTAARTSAAPCSRTGPMQDGPEEGRRGARRDSRSR